MLYVSLKDSIIIIFAFFWLVFISAFLAGLSNEGSIYFKLGPNEGNSAFGIPLTTSNFIYLIFFQASCVFISHVIEFQVLFALNATESAAIGAISFPFDFQKKENRYDDKKGRLRIFYWFINWFPVRMSSSIIIRVFLFTSSFFRMILLISQIDFLISEVVIAALSSFVHQIMVEAGIKNKLKSKVISSTKLSKQPKEQNELILHNEDDFDAENTDDSSSDLTIQGNKKN